MHPEAEPTRQRAYEPPALAVLGPVTEYTFGTKSFCPDGANTRQKNNTNC